MNLFSNSEESYKINKIIKLFPYLNNRSKAVNLKIDDESWNYISIRKIAEQITGIIMHHLSLININPDNSIITDATAGVGGNTISFGQSANKVYAIEIDTERSKLLANNIDVFNLKNIKVYNDDCLNILPEIDNHNVIFIDPPWGGKNYKTYEKLNLYIGEMPIDTVCIKLLDNVIMKKVPELIVLKLPKNYDIETLYKNIDKKYKIYLYELEKMLVIVIHCPSELL